ncbi:MAG: thioredoxin family protein [Odoribacter sp.]
MKKIVLLTFVFLIHLAVSGQGIIFMDNPEWKDAVEIARKSGKLIFVDCYTSWCGPCRILMKDVFPLERVGKAYNPHFIAVKYDMEKPAGKVFARHLAQKVESYPTLLFIDPVTGKVIYYFTGSAPADNIIAEARRCLSRHRMTELDTQYAAGDRSFEFMKEYFTAKSDMENGTAEVPVLIDDYLHRYDTLSNLLQPEKWRFYKNFLTDIRTDYMQYVIVNYGKFRRQPFVDRQKLNEHMGKILNEALNQSFRFVVDEKTGDTNLYYDQAYYDLVRKNITQLLRFLPAHERLIVRVCLYDCLVAGNWTEAYAIAKYMVLFQFPSSQSLQLAAYHYMAQQTDDVAVLTLLLSAFREIQQQRSLKFVNANYYNHIALVAGKLGLEKEAQEAEQKYYELCKQSEQRTVQNKKTKGKKR